MTNTPKTWRGFTLHKPKYFEPKTGQILKSKDLESQLKTDILNLQTLAQWQIDSHGLELLSQIDQRKEKPNTAGLYLGLHLPQEVKQSIFQGKSGVSRYEKIWRGEIITTLRSWKTRYDVARGEVTPAYTNAGFKRTARDTKPQIPPKMNLAYADPQYAEWVSPDTLMLVINGHKHHLLFNIPEKYKNHKLALPTIRITKTGQLAYDFAASQDYQQCELSNQYIIGVDLGLAKPATAIAYDAKAQEILESTILSRRVNSLANSIKASQKQIKYLYKKYDRLLKQSRYSEAVKTLEEIKFHRSKNVGKKLELARLIGQEVADLAFKYNAVVAVEDLSWIKNTMSSGRWNRGEVVKWVEHYVEQNGSRVVRVNAAYSSQNCSECGSRVSFRGRVAVCSVCSLELDRDVNAASNLAQRAVKSVEKMVKTRSKSRYFKAKKPKRVSPKKYSSLKYPGQDRSKSGPTRKRSSIKLNSNFSSCQAVKIVKKTVDNVWRDGQQVVDQDSKEAASNYNPEHWLQPLQRL